MCFLFLVPALWAQGPSLALSPPHIELEAGAAFANIGSKTVFSIEATMESLTALEQTDFEIFCSTATAKTFINSVEIREQQREFAGSTNESARLPDTPSPTLQFMKTRTVYRSRIRGGVVFSPNSDERQTLEVQVRHQGKPILEGRVHFSSVQGMKELRLSSQGFRTSADEPATILLQPANWDERRRWQPIKTVSELFAGKASGDCLVLGSWPGVSAIGEQAPESRAVFQTDVVGDATLQAACPRLSRLLESHESGRLLILPPVEDLRAKRDPRKLVRALEALVSLAHAERPEMEVMVATPYPNLMHPEASEAYAKRIRQVAFERNCTLIDAHEACLKGGSEFRFSQDGFLFWNQLQTGNKPLSQLLEPAQLEASDARIIPAEGRALRIRLRGTESARSSDEERALMAFGDGSWISEHGDVHSSNGVCRVTYPGRGGDLILHPFSCKQAGPGRLHVTVESSHTLNRLRLPNCFLKDKDGRCFETAPISAKRHGDVWRLSYDLRAEHPDVHPVGHGAVWGELYRRRTSFVGFSHFRHEDQACTLGFSEMTFEPFAPQPASAVRVVDFRVPRSSVERLQTFESRFSVSGLPSGNHFDPEVVETLIEVVTPAGTTNRVAGFLFQNYHATMDGHDERLSPVGPVEWRTRYTPVEAGKFAYRIGVVTPDAEHWSATYQFHCIEKSVESTSDPVGFIRVSKRNPRYFEDEQGAFFYPVGLNMHTPFDHRNASAFGSAYKVKGNPGTAVYERILPRLAAAGGNTITVWLAPWWLEFEWTASYPGCHGLTDFHLGRAWQLDRVLELAREHGIRVNLSFENHGKFSGYMDSQWDENPYNKKLGGPVHTCNDFFRSISARDIYRKKLDYILARWGHDPHIMSFELASESDFFGDTRRFHKGPEVRNWHVETANYLREKGVNPHLISAHYAIDMNRVDFETVARPEIDFFGVDAYGSGTSYRKLLLNEDRNEIDDKPYVTWEFGGDPGGASIEQIKADLHFGLWSSLFLEAGNAPMLWWYELADRENVYPDIAAFTAFSASIDKRLPSSTHRVNLLDRSGSVHGFIRWASADAALPGTQIADGWIGDNQTIYGRQEALSVVEDGSLPTLPVALSEQENLAAERQEGVQMRVPRLPWNAVVEFWDTESGEMTARTRPQRSGGSHSWIELPPFYRSIAFRIRTAN